MLLMVQQDQPDDYVVATGESHSIRDVLDIVFGYLALDWHQYVTQHPTLIRPAEVDSLRGDSSKAHARLGWTHTIGFEQLIIEMAVADWELEKKNTHTGTSAAVKTAERWRRQRNNELGKLAKEIHA